MSEESSSASSVSTYGNETVDCMLDRDLVIYEPMEYELLIREVQHHAKTT